jgi:hypothetical protein
LHRGVLFRVGGMVPVIRTVLIGLVTVSAVIASFFVRGEAIDNAHFISMLPFVMLLHAVVLWAGWRGSRRIFAVLAGLWFLFGFLITITVLLAGQSDVFSRSVAGFQLDGAMIALGMTSLGLLNALALLWMNERDMTSLIWAPLNTSFSVVFAAAFLVIIVDLEPLSEGILLVMPIITNLAFASWKRVPYRPDRD